MKYWKRILQVLTLSTLFLGSSISLRSGEYIVTSESPKSDLIIFSTQNGQILEYDASNQTLRTLADNCRSPVDPSFSSDEQSIVFSDRIDNSTWGLFRLDLLSREKQQLTSQYYDRYPRENGKNHLIFTRAKDLNTQTESWQICSLDESSKRISVITEESYFRIDGLCVAGDDFYFTARKSRSVLMDLYVVRGFGTNTQTPTEKVFKNSIDATRASNVSTDGMRLIFSSDTAKRYHYDIMIYEPDKELFRHLGLTGHFRVTMSPLFSTDGETVFFLASEGFSRGNRPEYGLWAVDSDESNVRQLLDAKTFASGPKQGIP